MKQSKIDNLTAGYARQGFTDRQIKNRLKKEEEREQAERNQKPVKSVTISIEWRKSRTWGNNPHASARVEYIDGTWNSYDGYTASGCGYDKESTVIASALNDILRYKLWEIEDNAEMIASKPYGVRLSYDYNPHFEGGVGTSCYYRIAEWLGGTMKHTASGKTFDVYTIEF